MKAQATADCAAHRLVSTWRAPAWNKGMASPSHSSDTSATPSICSPCRPTSQALMHTTSAFKSTPNNSLARSASLPRYRLASSGLSGTKLPWQARWMTSKRGQSASGARAENPSSGDSTCCCTG